MTVLAAHEVTAGVAELCVFEEKIFKVVMLCLIPLYATEGSFELLCL